MYEGTSAYHGPLSCFITSYQGHDIQETWSTLLHECAVKHHRLSKLLPRCASEYRSEVSSESVTQTPIPAAAHEPHSREASSLAFVMTAARKLPGEE